LPRRDTRKSEKIKNNDENSKRTERICISRRELSPDPTQSQITEQTNQFQSQLQSNYMDLKSIKTTIEKRHSELLKFETITKTKIDNLVTKFCESLKSEVLEYQSATTIAREEINDQISKLKKIASLISARTVDAEITSENAEDQNKTPPKEHADTFSNSETNTHPDKIGLSNDGTREQLTNLLNNPQPPPPPPPSDGVKQSDSAIIPFTGIEVLIPEVQIGAGKITRITSTTRKENLSEIDKPNFKFPHLRKTINSETDWTTAR